MYVYLSYQEDSVCINVYSILILWYTLELLDCIVLPSDVGCLDRIKCDEKQFRHTLVDYEQFIWTECWTMISFRVLYIGDD